MRWTERERAMLAEMGVHLPQWPGAVKIAGPEPALEASREPARAPAHVSPPTPAPRRADPVSGPSATVAAGQVAARNVVAQPVSASAGPAPEGSEQRTAAIASMDWAQLRAAVQQCRACSLCETRKQTVFGVGHEQAHWMIVGEAPGEQEDLRGEPFVGAAGQLLDNMLKALGLTRGSADGAHQVFIANTLKCRPPRNRNPEPHELTQCEPFLKRQVALVSPRVILAMGRFAVQQLLGSSEAVGRLRGQVHRYQGIPLVVTYHPAYLLRNPVDKGRAWADLCLAASVVAAGASPRS